ncbi:Lipoprotein [Streptomyces sp. FR-008]|nr:Lipoprotein [Streptomyces sp. FR-008]
MMCDYALAAPVRKLRFTRSGDTHVRQGEMAEISLQLTNTSSRPLRALLRDAWPPSNAAPGATDAARHRVDVPAGGTRELHTQLRPTRRGEAVAHSVTVRSYGPLGLVSRQATHRVPGSLRVLPPFHSRRLLAAKTARLRELDGRTSALGRGEGTEFDSLRRYVPGDDTRSIDWRATARRSEVAVRTWRPERDRRVLIVLDTGRTSAGRVGDAPRLDAAMDAALFLSALASRAGDRVDLLAFDRELRAQVRGKAAPQLLPALVDGLASLEPQLVETDARGLAAEIQRSTPRRALVVLLTTLDTTPVEEGLLPVLDRLTDRHTLLVASVADLRLAEMAAARGTVEKVYQAAAGHKAQAERDRTAGLLRRRGVTVVDAPPADLASALADAYLSAKAAGKL